MKFKIRRQKFNTSGNLAWEYNPLRNVESVDKALSDFDTDKLALDINHPVDIECQPSYDGSTNIIFNDDYNVPRIVNSAFSVLEDNTYERVSRNQEIKTNIYKEASLDSETRLQRTSSGFLKFDLKEVSDGGELAGGNYVFVAQYSDDDGNKSAVVAESGIVSIFSGHLAKPNTMFGTLLHEKTNKCVKLELTDIDQSFSKIYISYRRDFCDLNGVKQSEYKALSRPYNITSDTIEIVLDGIEPTETVSYEDLVASRNIYNKVKTSAQNQNMLFFGNVEESYEQQQLLQKLALYIQVCPVWGNSIGRVNQENYLYTKSMEYFNVHNIYDNIGYMPEEYYRIGVVFIYNDDTRSAVYNLRGCAFTSMFQWNFYNEVLNDGDSAININDLFIGNSTGNTKGVFKMPYVNLIASSGNINTINLKFAIPAYIASTLATLNIKGCYFVRQSRIPVFLTQGYSIGVSDTAHIPMLGTLDDKQKLWYSTDTFLEKTPDHIKIIPQRYSTNENVTSCGLFCPDAIMSQQLHSLFTGSNFVLKEVGSYTASGLRMDLENTIEQYPDKKVQLLKSESKNGAVINRELVYIPRNSSYRSYKNHVFSSKAGSSVDVKSLRSVEGSEYSFELNAACVRGEFTPYIGVISEQMADTDVLNPNSIYNIYTTEYGTSKDKVKQAIKKRAYNYSEYTAICDPLTVQNTTAEIYAVCARGDCFTCTTQHKFMNNFLDPVAPLNTIQVKSEIKYGKSKKGQSEEIVQSLWKNSDQIDAAAWLEINTSDVNSVDFGHYVSAKYMSNFNHNLRSIDQQNVDEVALYGSPRQFLPYAYDVSGVGFKIPESGIHNSGLSSTRTIIPHFEAEQVPFINKHFDTRIAFSNISSTSSFANGYRVFSGVSYQDIERTYGAIVKILPLGQNLFCVFEHGCGIIPVNEKALMSTTTGQSIHLYGAGVLQEQVTVVSQDYGSTWEDSIVVTPNGIYGVDTWAKKIWRYTAEGFELLSDQLVQRFLNDNITMTEADWCPTVALKNVKTHYNAYKGDVMFTFYRKESTWNLCFNERIKKFVTRYSWSPLLSDNIQNSFVSIDKSAVAPLAAIAESISAEKGLYMDKPEYYQFKFRKQEEQYNALYKEIKGANGEVDDVEIIPVKENTCYFSRRLTLRGYSPANSLIAHIRSVSYPVWKDDHVEVETIINDSNHGFWIDDSVKVIKRIEGEIVHEDEVDDEGNPIVTPMQDVETISKYKTSVVGWDEKTHVKTEDDFTWESSEWVTTADEYYNDNLSDSDDGDENLGTEFNNFKAKWKNYVSCSSDSNAELEVKLDRFVSWLKIDLSVKPLITTLKTENAETMVFEGYDCAAQGTPFTQTIYFVADPSDLRKQISEAKDDVERKAELEAYLEQYSNILRVGLYTHGRAGIYDEINYTDLDPDNQIKPTFWYNKQEPFELEFVVNTPTGIQKMFDNLVIISNNAEPESLEISLIGDAYNFNKVGIFRAENTTIPYNEDTGILDLEALEKAKCAEEFKNSTRSQSFDITYKVSADKEVKFDTSVVRDSVLNQYMLVVNDSCRDVKTWGKRLGNIEYREDKWLITLSPIMFKNTAPIVENGEITGKTEGSVNSTKLRDKWCKIRIKYKGDKLVVISALQTLMSLSYS